MLEMSRLPGPAPGPEMSTEADTGMSAFEPCTRPLVRVNSRADQPLPDRLGHGRDVIDAVDATEVGRHQLGPALSPGVDASRRTLMSRVVHPWSGSVEFVSLWWSLAGSSTSSSCRGWAGIGPSWYSSLARSQPAESGHAAVRVFSRVLGTCMCSTATRDGHPRPMSNGVAVSTCCETQLSNLSGERTESHFHSPGASCKCSPACFLAWICR